MRTFLDISYNRQDIYLIIIVILLFLAITFQITEQVIGKTGMHIKNEPEIRCHFAKLKFQFSIEGYDPWFWRCVLEKKVDESSFHIHYVNGQKPEIYDGLMRVKPGNIEIDYEVYAHSDDNIEIKSYGRQKYRFHALPGRCYIISFDLHVKNMVLEEI